MAMLEAHALSKWYGPHQALQACDLHLEAGETVGFLGPNGAGKSTTMNILAGVLAPSAGSVRIAGLDPVREPLRCRQQVGFLPQQQPLYLDMRVSGYLDHVARLKRIPATARRREVVDALNACDLTAVAERRIRALSGGNRQRVALAQALLGRPPILILDEPTAGLDPTQVHKLRGLLAELGQRHSILLSTHIMAEVEATCSRVIIIHRGRLILTEPIAALRERSRQHQRLALRLMQPEQLDACNQTIAALPAVQVTVDEDQLLVHCASEQRQQLIAIAQEHGGLRELVELRRSLEDVFTELTEEPQHV